MRRLGFVATLLVGLASATPALGQLQRRRPPQEAPAVTSLKSKIGLDAAKKLLRSDAPGDRVRAFERLAELGTEPALELLSRTLDAGGPARSGGERLAATRAMARHAKSTIVRAALIRALSAPAAPERADPLLGVARDTAALALARSGDGRALAALGQALRQPGRGAEAALTALEAYPPADPSPLLDQRGAVTPTFVEFLERCSDPRAVALLAAIAQRGSPETRAQALGSLARRDPKAAAELVRDWESERHPALRAAAVEVLARSHARDASRALALLFEAGKRDPEAFDRAIAISLDAPAPAFAPALQGALKDADPEQKEKILAALGRASGPEAIAFLGGALTDPALSSAAAHALALAGSDGANHALERALAANGLPRRQALRAAALRTVVLDQTPDGTEGAGDALLASPEPADRAAAAYALAVLEPERGRALLSSKDPVIVRAAARASLSGGYAIAAAEQLTRERDALTRAALALALADDEAAERVPNRDLEALLEHSPAAAPLAARALCTRDDEVFRARVERLLTSPDVRLRAHAASGLARSSEPSAVGLLERAYREEPDPGVRRAIVIALGQRTERGRRRALELAAALEPDADARRLAREALAGTPRDAGEAADGSAWLTVVAGGDSGLFALVTTSAGLSLPAAVDPDGFAALSGLPHGPIDLDLAPAAPEGQALKKP